MENPLPESDPRRQTRFTPEVLDRTVIAIPLLTEMRSEFERLSNVESEPQPRIFDVMIDLNLMFESGEEGARSRLRKLIKSAIETSGKNKEEQGVVPFDAHRYVIARLEAEVISKLVKLDEGPRLKNRQTKRCIFRIWPDFDISDSTNKSISTVKADAARVSFSALGDGIVWAVLDSGIDETHPHFSTYDTLKLEPPLVHRDYTTTHAHQSPLSDEYGHGTHVAGIIAGALTVAPEGAERRGAAIQNIRALSKSRDSRGNPRFEKIENVTEITGMAPKCKLMSLKVINQDGTGKVSRLIAALNMVHRLNDYGREIRIHGVNLSVGYEFQPEWFACGQSPLCVEVDLLVRSGVIVVVAAGNTGYGYNDDEFKGSVSAGQDLTINDPGNADKAITVGSTHREMPHVYGVSYFSSKGPTGDGRMKPDLVAPGEKIISCAAGSPKRKAEDETGQERCDYIEDSGTSMAAPHVSGVLAAFLSIRKEFIGQPERVKEIFMSTATDLHRDPHFQGRGLVDLMRAIQSV